DAVSEGPGLPADTAAVEAGHDVELLVLADRAQRLRRDHAMDSRGEVLLQRASVELELSGPGHDRDPGHGLLAPTGPVRPVLGHLALSCLPAATAGRSRLVLAIRAAPRRGTLGRRCALAPRGRLRRRLPGRGLRGRPLGGALGGGP